MGKPLRVLIVEDSDDDYVLLLRELRRGGFEPDVRRVETDPAMRQALDEQAWDIILADFVLPHFSGIAALQALRTSGQDIPFIVVSGTIGEETAVQAMRMGAHDYIMKDRLARLPAAIEHELAEAEVRRARRQAETALRESEERYRLLFELESDAIVIIENATGRLLAANQAASDLYGYTREELLALKNTDLSAEPAETRRVTAESPIDPEKMIYIPVRYHQNKNGEIFPVEITGRFFAWQGRDVHIAAIRNIAERVRAEQLLKVLNRASLAMSQAITHQSIFDAVADELGQEGLACAILLVDAERHSLVLVDQRFGESINQAVRQMISASPATLAISIAKVDCFRKVFDGQKAVMVQDVMLLVRQLWPGADPSSAEQLAGLFRSSHVIVAPLVRESQVFGLFIVQSDDLHSGDLPAMTAFANQVAAAWHKADLLQRLQDNLEELKRTQDQLVQAHKMEAVGRLAGGVAHDFNNHLTAIIGYAEMLQAAFDPQDPRYGDVSEIRKAAERSAELTRQLLAFSRKQIIRPRVLNLADLIHNMDGMLRRLIGEDIDLQVDLAADLGMVEADPGQIEQVVMNLVVNARDAMSQGGHLTVAAANADLDQVYAQQYGQVQPGSYVMLSIADTGSGMDQQTISHLFEPFFTTKGVGKGTGLGLATVYGIVKQSNGSILVHSEPGVGTTFQIFLPRRRALPANQASETVSVNEAASIQSGNETVLLVEDEDAVRDLAWHILRQSGYTVIQAHNADEAVAQCALYAGPIHLLLTDVIMPGQINSQEMVERITASRPGIKILYMSGYTDDALAGRLTTAQRGALAPGVRLLNKPFTLHTLTYQVRQVLDEEA